MSELPQYQVARVQRALAEDERTSELGIRVTIRGPHIHLRGEVATTQRKDAVERVVHELMPALAVHNDLRVLDAPEPTSEEDLR